MRLKNPDYAKNNIWLPVELNFTIKFLFNIVLDFILATKNFSFALERIYHLFLTVDLDSKLEIDAEKTSTKILVLKNIMNSMKTNIIYVMF